MTQVHMNYKDVLGAYKQNVIINNVYSTKKKGEYICNNG